MCVCVFMSRPEYPTEKKAVLNFDFWFDFDFHAALRCAVEDVGVNVDALCFGFGFCFGCGVVWCATWNCLALFSRDPDLDATGALHRFAPKNKRTRG